MKRFQLTLSQRRFLIVWTIFHSLALLVNFANFDGRVYEGDSSAANVDIQAHKKTDTINISIDNSRKAHFNLLDSISKLKPGQEVPEDPNLITRYGYVYSNNNHLTVNLFTTNKSDDFWPFTTFYDEEPPTSFDMHTTYRHFYGIFNSYSFKAYIFYMFIGLVFVFVPKLWKKE